MHSGTLRHSRRILPMSVDLHSHSTASDGSYSPSKLAHAMHAADVRIAALTDHDTVGGVDEFLSECEKIGMFAIGGIEFSTVFRGMEVHLLGYGLPLDDPRCSAYLKNHSDYLISRCEKILSKLGKFDLHASIEQVLEESGGNPPMPPHILQVLADNGYYSDLGAAMVIFQEYLSFGAKAWIDHETQLESPLNMMIDVGAKAIVAHPYKFPDLSWLDDILDMGTHGFELYHPEIGPDLREELRQLALKRDCLVSGGCDFHGAFSHRTLGEVEISLSVGIEFLNALEIEIPVELATAEGEK